MLANLSDWRLRMPLAENLFEEHGHEAGSRPRGDVPGVSPRTRRRRRRDPAKSAGHTRHRLHRALLDLCLHHPPEEGLGALAVVEEIVARVSPIVARAVRHAGPARASTFPITSCSISRMPKRSTRWLPRRRNPADDETSRFAGCRSVGTTTVVSTPTCSPSREKRVVDGVRLAGKGDELALRRLSAACPMVGPVGYCLEREPNFFALTEIQGDDAEVGVIDGAERGTLDAMATSVRVVRRLAGGSQVLRYSGRFQGPSSCGEATDSREGFMHLASEKLEREKVPAFGIVLGGNQAMSPLLERAGARLRFHAMARLRNHSVFVSTPSMPRLVGDRSSPATSTSSASTEIPRASSSSFGTRSSASRAFASFGTSEVFSIRTGPGDPLERFWIARRGGRAVGCAAAWDASQIKQLRVQSLSSELVWVSSSVQRDGAPLGASR